MTPDRRPLLVFFPSQRSGPARRRESLLAHIARKERDLADRFRVDEVPSLTLVVEQRVVSRLDGRATAPRIESMLGPHLGTEQIAV